MLGSCWRWKGQVLTGDRSSTDGNCFDAIRQQLQIPYLDGPNELGTEFPLMTPLAVSLRS
jgi:hypothetical protein